jgi:hypothetical protein
MVLPPALSDGQVYLIGAAGGMLDRGRSFGGQEDSPPHSAATRAAISPARSGRLPR